VAAVGLVVVTVLAGCGGDEPGAGATASVTPTATPTATPTPTADIPVIPEPVLPDEAKEHTPAGAAAFTRFAIEVVNRAYVTGDTEQLLSISTEDCDACARVATSIRETFTGGDRYVGGQLSIVELTARPFEKGVIPTVITVLDESALSRVAADGTVVEEFDAVDDETIYWDLAWSGNWSLRDVRQPE
jgi:hypothetical protein